MHQPVTAELISVGTELLRGEIVDTNASYVASRLPLFGIELRRMSTAGDDLACLSQMLAQSLQRVTLVIMSGGLGPTQDDLTRDAIAAALGEQLTVDPALESSLRTMFSRSGREMPPHNIQQAMIIPSATGLANPRGTAPGWWVGKGGKVIVTLPGPPREMSLMWDSEVAPRLRKRFPTLPILARTVKTFLVPEARVAELMKPFFGVENPTLGIYAKADGIHVRLVATGLEAARLLDETEKKVRELLVPYVWGKDDETLDGVVGSWLVKRHLTLATMEELSAGVLAQLLSTAPTSELFYRGGVVASGTNAQRMVILPPRGGLAVDASLAEMVAKSVREAIGADIGVYVSNITKSQEGRLPAGTAFIGVADSQGVRTWQQQYQPGRTDTRERAAVAALFRLRERMIELGLDK